MEEMERIVFPFKCNKNFKFYYFIYIFIFKGLFILFPTIISLNNYLFLIKRDTRGWSKISYKEV